jgi:hypothetical protein
MVDAKASNGDKHGHNDASSSYAPRRSDCGCKESLPHASAHWMVRDDLFSCCEMRNQHRFARDISGEGRVMAKGTHQSTNEDVVSVHWE